MKVKEMLKLLKKEDPEAVVLKQTDNTMEMGQEDVEVTRIHASLGVKKKKSCTDAFDGTNYNTDIWQFLGAENDEQAVPTVKIYG